MTLYSSVVGVSDSIKFYVISNGNVNICSIAANDIIIYVLSIGDALQTHITNNTPIIHCF